MIREFTELKVPEENVIRKDQRIRFKVELVNMPFLQEVRRIKMSTTEQEIIKRQLNYYLDKNIDTLKNKFYGKDGIWSRYHKFIDRFKIDDKKIEVKINNSWSELSLDTYCLGRNHKDPNHTDEKNFGAFSWWVEFYLRDLGSVGGTSSGAHGIYSGKSCYQNSENNSVNEVDNTKLQNMFRKDTYYWIKNKLRLSTDKEAHEDFGCKPQEVVLNKIYYLFKMKSNKDNLNHLIPIFKINDEILKKLDIISQEATWKAKSAEIYNKFNDSLNDDVKKLLNDEAPTESVNDLKNNDQDKEISINLFKSYCFGCFYWSTLENKGGLSDKIDELILRGDKNIILTGAPGTGKTFACQSYAREQVCNFTDNLKTVDGNDQSSSFTTDYFIKTVQFHPGYDYSDFIEGIRPIRPKRDDSDGSTIYYDRKDGIFKDFCKQVVNFNEKHKNDNLSKSAKFFFIIDEINRGEVSKIFGEAFSMIETDKRAPVGSDPKDVTNKVETQYSSLIEDENDPFQHGFYIPENVYILATMNEIDRSLEAMDFAIRRRFSWLTVEVQDTLNEIIVNSVLDDCTNSVFKYMSAIEYSFNKLNDLIETKLGPDYMLGGSYLTSLKNSSRTSVIALKEELWNNHLEPIIKDYLKGTGDEIQNYKKIFVGPKKEDSKNDAS